MTFFPTNFTDVPTLDSNDIFLLDQRRKATGAVVRAYAAELGVVLIWDDVSDYIPADLKAATSPKEFRGPTDPDTVTGVVLNPYDTWIDTAP